MKRTLVLEVSSQQPQMEKIQVAADLIKKGGLVAFPTETVYGLGADALNQEAVKSLFEAKNRPFDNPPIIHVGNMNDVSQLAKRIPPKAERLMKYLWPGPLTLVLERSEIVPNVTVADLDTIAVRMPKHEVALALIRESHCSIAAPSANLAGKPSPTTAQHVMDDLKGRIDIVLDAGTTDIGVESTVLDVTADPPQILRPGGTPYELLKEILRDVELHPVAISIEEISVEAARSPGVKHKHYAPEADLIVVEGEFSAVVRKVKELNESYLRRGCKVGVLATDESLGQYTADILKSLGSRRDLTVIGKNMFGLLREFDSKNVDVIIAEAVPTKKLGLAVMNRLRKASGYRIVKAADC